MKLLTLSCAVVIALIFTGPTHDCTGLENGAGHVDHCQGCLLSATSSAVIEKSSPPLPDFEFVGIVAGAPESGYPRIQVAQHRNRAPPLP